MLRLQFTFALLLALSLFSNGAHGFWRSKQVIGYAMVSKEHAKAINKNHDLIVQVSPKYQVGAGFYLRDRPGWERQVGKWYCVIKADKKKIKAARKVTIPKFNQIRIAPDRSQTTTLYGAEEHVISNYIAIYRGLPQPDKVLRFSWVEGLDQQRQMTIPAQMVMNDDLETWAKCFETEEKLRKYSEETIEWERDWKPDVDFQSIAPPRQGSQRGESGN
ncbi:hypothetical protein MBM_03065 [Drepanopeziza brunnea f. sp. 'multigermtubi' MB_m1]|uniref:Uncharacterized protein n=1 Tax=Marssonina brunnea f. sp. multigermtubi (strain MB_m1) TaxID=1072389 RepID=K1XDA3_MARBU|nr:uncharacterized protein MBM_03065 [Drepanopeziza brunnea f. sp. 'multigermtubi' MB_m1]EKD18823.1 hypothetical protein MBM_03065 [Drepanopeziza brunnea f. sp. 'multigermtubi' MB_m1]